MKQTNCSIKKDKKIEDALEYIELNGLGLVFIEDRKKIIGVITDGDIRRALIKKKNLNMNITSFMRQDFVFLRKGNDTRENILKLLDSRIKAIPVLDEKDKLQLVKNLNKINFKLGSLKAA